MAKHILDRAYKAAERFDDKVLSDAIVQGSPTLKIRAEKISNLLHDFYQEIGARIATNEEKKK